MSHRVHRVSEKKQAKLFLL